MYDDYVTQELTIKRFGDAQSHFRFGTRRFNVWSRRWNHDYRTVIAGVRYLKPAHSFPNTMDYNNVMFIVAGEVIHKISGKLGQNLLKKELYETCWNDFQVLVLITVLNLMKIDAYVQSMEKQFAVPHDGMKLPMQLGNFEQHYRQGRLGKFLNEWFRNQRWKRLVSEKNANIFWQIQQPIPMAKNPYDTKFYGYGLKFGLFLMQKVTSDSAYRCILIGIS